MSKSILDRSFCEKLRRQWKMLNYIQIDNNQHVRVTTSLVKQSRIGKENRETGIVENKMWSIDNPLRNETIEVAVLVEVTMTEHSLLVNYLT